MRYRRLCVVTQLYRLTESRAVFFLFIDETGLHPYSHQTIEATRNQPELVASLQKLKSLWHKA